MRGFPGTTNWAGVRGFAGNCRRAAKVIWKAFTPRRGTSDGGVVPVLAAWTASTGNPNTFRPYSRQVAPRVSTRSANRLPASLGGPEPVPKSGVGAGLLAQMIVSKYVDHLPLYRQEAIFARLGWPVSRTRLCDLIRDCAVLLDPVYRAMIARMKLSFAIHVDDSPVKLLQPNRTAYAWLYLGDAAHPYTLFDFTPGRGDDYPAAFLQGYSGYVHADGYSGYNAVHGSGARHLGCWAHVRRKFVEAQANDPAKASEALAYIRTLYAVEKEIVEGKLTGVTAANPGRADPEAVRRVASARHASRGTAAGSAHFCYPLSPLHGAEREGTAFPAIPDHIP